MKSARERAFAVAESYGITPSHRHYLSLIDETELAFKEHARDQRHLIAEQVRNAAFDNAHPFVRDFAPAAHHAAMNTPAPGEQS